MAGSTGRDGSGIEAPFVFVRRGDPQPSEWMVRRPGWVRVPAALVTRPEPRSMSMPCNPDRNVEAGPDEPVGFAPASRPAALGAPVVRRRSIPVHRLPTGSGGFDTEDAVAAYLQVSDAMEAAASTYLASASGSSAARERVSAGPAAGASDAHKVAASGEHHGQARHGKATLIRTHYSPITAGAASEIASALLNPKIQAFLRLLNFEEFGRESDENYRIRYGDLRGHDPITDQDILNYKPKNMRPHGKPATAGGAYQILDGTYEEAIGRKVSADFLPASQDKIAVYLLCKLDALQSISDHDLDQVFALLNGTWSSLPGGTQVKEKIEDAKLRYDKYLAEEKGKKGSTP